ncbi:hypothetical protein [Streptomyces sp. NBRC 109706]|uniref:hypothetical protein n=1 Tax=Streptomyces sp. NBRC 109706 TaxID=1550035 RepID=UPI000B0CBC1F|nr:hypothetical protein [Streptomyces sp. NBRC 109706]
MSESQEQDDETESPEPAEPDEAEQDDGHDTLRRRLREVNARSERNFQMRGGQLW